MLPISARYRDALDYAARLHAEQTRKGSDTPYLAHLLSVSALAMEWGADEDQAIAALLHDAAEDQGGRQTLEKIRQRFGDRVAGMVRDLSDTLDEPKPPWKARKQAYLTHLQQADPEVLLVSACDKLHNLRSILDDLIAEGPAVFERFQGGRDGTLWYYDSLASAFQKHANVQHFAGAIARVLHDIRTELAE
ncbi:MAG: HD domain-containing protein [Planctomycetaceae bacterium]